MHFCLFLQFCAVTCLVAAFDTEHDAARSRHRKRASGKLKLPTQSNIEYVPNTYIVEFSPGSSAAGLRKRALNNNHPLSLAAVHSGFTIEQELTQAPSIFNGASIKVSDDANLQAIVDAPEVQNIWPVYKFQIPIPPVDSRLQKRAQKWKTPADIYPAHVQIGADKLHAEGITGKGQLVAIVDSGVDYTHPDLGGCLGPSCKVIKGYDFVGDDINDASFAPNRNPYSQCTGFIHGTAVAGLVAATPSDTGFSGVAPDAKLASYRIADCSGNSNLNLLIQGLLLAYGDGGRLINIAYSLIGGWPEDLVSVIVDRLKAAGALVVSSTGDYPQGAFYANQPSTARDGLSVGGVETKQLIQFTAIDQSERQINYYGSHSFGPDTYSTYLTSNDSAVVDDACSPLPSATPDLTGRVAIVRRGGCFTDQKALNVAAKNATGILIYNTPGSAIGYDDGIYYGFDSGNMGLISAEDGAYLLDQWLQGNTISLHFPPKLVTIKNTVSSGFSQMSQYGPTYEMTPVPKILAPSNYILTLAPVQYGLYTVFSYTSAATPLVAGSVALYYTASRKRSYTPFFIDQVISAITSTATPVPSGPNFQTLSLAQQGAGVINIYGAVKASTTFDTSFLLLNDTRYFQKNQQVTIYNISPWTKFYTISNSPALTLLTNPSGSIYPSVNPATSARGASISLVKSRLTIKGNSKATITISFKPPILDTSTFPIYSGYINIRSSNQDNYRIPYMGMAAALIDMPVIDSGSAVLGYTLPLIATPSGSVQSDPMSYTMTGNDFPTFYYRLVAGSRYIVLEALAASTAYVATLPSSASNTDRPPQDPTEDLLGVVTSGIFSARNGVSTSIGLATSSSTYQTVGWQGALNNGTALPNGSYKLRFRALKITGNLDIDADYESWLSPTIVIARPSS